MRIATPLAAVILSLLTAQGAQARPPPPPALTPSELETPYDGYDLRTPYQLWRYWIEGQKGLVIEALIAQAETPPDEAAFGAPLITFKAFGDLGQFVGGDVRAYCRRKGAYGFDREACHYVVRRAVVPLDAGSSGANNPLSTWMRQNFEPQTLAAHLKAAGFAPDTNWWSADRKKMFAQQPSPADILKREAKVIRVDSRDCPALAKTILAMETRRVDVPVDFWAVGEEGKLNPPWPHSTQWIYTLNLMVAGNAITIEGGAKPVTDIVGPVFDAANACERAASRQ